MEPKYKKYSFNLYPADIEALREIRQQSTIIQNVTQALRSAIATEHYIRQQISEGGKVYVKRPDDSVAELVFK